MEDPRGKTRRAKSASASDGHAIQGVIGRLASNDQPYSSAAELLEDLDRISVDIPSHQEAWNRLLETVASSTVPIHPARRAS
jgi:hypothetical protein